MIFFFLSVEFQHLYHNHHLKKIGFFGLEPQNTL